MKLSSMLCASLMGLVGLALTAQGASAAPQFSVNASRFDPYKLKANDPNGEKDCTAKGGAVFTDNQGAKTCKDVQDNAVAETGTCPKDKGSATGGAGDGKAGVTARTDSQRGVWKAPAGIESKTAKPTGDGEAPISDKTAGDSTGGPRIGSPYNDCANKAVPVPTEQNQ